MTSLFAARRAAEEFANLVDATGPAAADRYAELAGVVTLLREQPRPQARPAFVADLRSRLMAAAETELRPALRAVPTTTSITVTPRRTTTRQRRLGSAAAAALVVVGGTTGIAAAAQHALPGEGLYSVKRGIETAAAAFNASEAGKGADLLAQAGTRLEEVEALSAAGADAGTVSATLGEFEAAANKGAGLLFTSYQSTGRSSDIATVRSFAADQLAALDAAAASAPAGSAEKFAAAAEALSAIDTQAVTLCSGCGGGGLSGFGGADADDALESLISKPAAEAPKIRTTLQQSPQAAAAEEVAGQVDDPEGTLGEPPTTPTDPAPTQPPPPPTPAQVLEPVQETVNGVTEPVTGLVDQIGQDTGLSAVTDPVTSLLNGLG